MNRKSKAGRRRLWIISLLLFSSSLLLTLAVRLRETIRLLPILLGDQAENGFSINLQESKQSRAARKSNLDTSFAVFFNAFVSAEKPLKSLAVINEQMQHVSNLTRHYVLNGYINETAPPIYYNTIGLDKNDSVPCYQPSVCQHLNHYQEGHEDVTLQALFDYCTANPLHIVAYLHDKGSFHPHPRNNRLRRLGTKGAMACLRALQQQQSSTMTNACNVCAFRFESHPFAHVPGNHWSAKCSYIQTLTPPKEYNGARKSLCQFISSIPKLNNNNNSPCPIHGEQVNVSVEAGLGRHAFERWIPSHPSFVPCQVLQNDSLKHFVTGWDDWTPEIKMAHKKGPRFSEAETQALELQMMEHAYLYGPDAPRTFCETYFNNKRRDSCPHLKPSFLEALTSNNNKTWSYISSKQS